MVALLCYETVCMHGAQPPARRARPQHFRVPASLRRGRARAAPRVSIYPLPGETYFYAFTLYS